MGCCHKMMHWKISVFVFANNLKKLLEFFETPFSRTALGIYS